MYCALSLRLVAHRAIQRSRNVFIIIIIIIIIINIMVMMMIISYSSIVTILKWYVFFFFSILNMPSEHFVAAIFAIQWTCLLLFQDC